MWASRPDRAKRGDRSKQGASEDGYGQLELIPNQKSAWGRDDPQVSSNPRLSFTAWLSLCLSPSKDYFALERFDVFGCALPAASSAALVWWFSWRLIVSKAVCGQLPDYSPRHPRERRVEGNLYRCSCALHSS